MANQTVYPYGQGGSLPSGYPIADDLETNSVQQALSARQGVVLDGKIDVINDDLYGADRDVQEFVDFENEYLYTSSIDSGTFYNNTSSGNYRVYKISVPEGMEQVVISSNSVFGTYFCITKTEVPSGSISGSSMESNYIATGCDGYTVTSPSVYRMIIPVDSSATIKLSANAKYIYIQKNYSDITQDFTPTSMVFTGHLRKDGKLAYLEESVDKLSSSSNNLTSGCSPKMYSGCVDSSGSLTSPTMFLTTEPIFGPFYIELNEGWKVYEGHLFDRDGNMVSYQYIHPEVQGINRRTSATWNVLSIENVVPEYGVRLTFCKLDGTAFTDATNVVKNYVNLLDAGLHRWIPEDLPNYERALRRIEYLQNLRWVPLAKVPNGYPSSSSTSATNVQNEHFDMAGQMAVGVPYSDVAETRTYVPNNVSIRTFLTATKNIRSLLYTEELHKGVSKYGNTYQQGHRRSYYGQVCSGFTAWVMGLDTLYLSYDYNNNTVPGLSTVVGCDASTVRPLDLIWWDGHVAIVSDIWLDEFGNRKFIVISEMTAPYPFRTIYTPEQFNVRCRPEVAEIHRWTGWDNLPEPEELREWSQYNLGDVRQEIKYNPDIMTFAGDYAAFAEGAKIYLNARRNSVYTGVELYKDDVLLQTIDITGLTADNIAASNTKDWVAVNLTSLNLTYGKYKARLTDGTTTTDYTYFEVIDITFTAAKTGSTVTAYFSSNEGTPVSLERVKTNGFADGYRPITAEMVEAGQATAFNVKTGYPNLVLLVKGDYGTVCKTIPIPTS